MSCRVAFACACDAESGGGEMSGGGESDGDESDGGVCVVTRPLIHCHVVLISYACGNVQTCAFS